MDNHTLSNQDYCDKAYTQAFVKPLIVDDEKQRDLQKQQAFTKAYTQETLVMSWAADAKAVAALEAKKTSLAVARNVVYDVVRIIADSLVNAFAIFGIIVMLRVYYERLV
jgi:hypothetical protein